MSQTIRRGGKGVRRAAAARGAARKVDKARRQTGSVIDALMRFLPFTEEQLHRGFLAVILGGAVALAWFVASLAGLPAMANAQIAVLAGEAGFEVRRVEVRGVERMNELRVYERALAQRDRAMPLVDLEGLRASLLDLPWVEDARVSRQLPDTLVVDIVERVPHAVLRKPNKLMVIDASGHELEPISAANAKGQLVISGPGAAKQVAALTRLLEAAPALQPQVREAQWVGNRRWNLTFKTGQVLALPQGDEKSSAALISFARLDGMNRLLGGEVVAFDMRAPDRIYMRIPGRAEREQMSTSAGKGAN